MDGQTGSSHLHILLCLAPSLGTTLASDTPVHATLSFFPQAPEGPWWKGASYRRDPASSQLSQLFCPWTLHHAGTLLWLVSLPSQSREA